ncbi:MAG TPA: VWA domain-containing protein [Terrimicrobiaceae bacterium]
MVDFDRPAFLLLIPAAIFLQWFGGRNSLTQWLGPQRTLCKLLRGTIFLLLGLALAGPRWLTTTTDPAVVLLRDVSASIPVETQTENQQFAEKFFASNPDRVAEVTFAREPLVVRGFGPNATREPSPASAGEATDLSSALEFAATLLPANRPGRIVVFSDGVFTSGRNPIETATQLGKVEIDTVPLPAASGPDAAVVSIKLPVSTREGEIFDLSAQLFSASAVESAAIRLYQNDLLVSETRRELPKGLSEFLFQNVRAEGRMGLYEVEVTAPQDSAAENNRKKVAIAHSGRPKVLVVDSNPVQAEPLAQALRASNFDVETRPPDGLPADIEGLEAFDLVAFSDAPAAEFSDDQMKTLEKWVKNFGGGFLMLGGEESFGAGGYFRTSISSLLPVRIEREEREETPVVALLVILDRSGSMSAPAGGQTKMALANEGAALALDVLQPKDLFGLFAVDTRVQEVVPLGRISDKQSASRRIAGITAGGGGIYIYTSLAEALPRLRDAQAKIKHVILFSDAADAEEKSSGEPGTSKAGTGNSSFDLAAAMLASRITVSVVALGTEQDKDTAFLRQLAAQGGGRFYLTADAATLPRLFAIETMRAAESSLREDAFLPQLAAPGEAVKGINWQEAPLLLGFNTSRLKSGAELLLATERGDPLLAHWRYGLGRVAAFTSDAKSRWASEWLGWSGYGKFWGQVARMLVRPPDRNDLVVGVREEGNALIVDAEAVTPEGMFRNGLEVTVSIAAQGTQPSSAKGDQVAPGLYRARLKKPETGSAIIAVSDGAGRPISRAWTGDYPAEFQVMKDGTPLLKELSSLTGGKFDVKPEEILRPALHPATTRRELAAWLLAAALLLWPLDIWLRRREWSAAGGNSLSAFSRAN